MEKDALIIKRNSSGTYNAMYCGFDGTPEKLGKVLVDNYQEDQLVEQLFEIGDTSAIFPTLAETKANSFANVTGYSKHVMQKEGKYYFSYVDFLKNQIGTRPWNYLYKDHKWYVARGHWKNNMYDAEETSFDGSKAMVTHGALQYKSKGFRDLTKKLKRKGFIK